MTGENNTGWKIATVVAVIMGLVLAGVVYVLMDQRNQELTDQLAAATTTAASATQMTSTTETATSTTTSTSSSVPETTTPEGSTVPIPGLDQELGELFEDALGPEGGALFEDLMGTLGEEGSSGLTGGLDPAVMQCLSPESMDLGAEGDLPEGDIDTQIDAIADLVAEDRGISSDEQLDIEFATREEVARRVRQLTEEELDPEVIDYQNHLYRALGAVPRDADVGQIQLDALDAAVGGFYDTETEKLVIGSEEIDALGALVISHEIQHAVADDALGLPDLETIDNQQGGDAALAALALVEGDASLISQQFMMEHLSFEDLLSVTMTSMETTQSLEGIPHHIRRLLEFPYLEGLSYVCRLTLQGGWETVDAVYDDLPQTSAEVLYGSDVPNAVDPLDPVAPAGWNEVGSDTFGAAELMFLLEAPGGDTEAGLDNPKERASVWGGGEVTVWSREDATALALRLRDGGGGSSLCETMTEFYGAAFPDANSVDERTFAGPNQVAYVDCVDDAVTLGIAPTRETAETVVGATP